MSSSPASPGLPQSHSNSNTPTSGKAREKKRVGFSQDRGTPLRDVEQSLEPSRPGSSSGLLPLEDVAEESDQLSHDGVDHNELTRALSRILRDEGKAGGSTEAGGSGSGSGRSPDISRSRSPGISRSRSPGHSQPTSPPIILEPEPSYFPTARQQKSEMAAKARADRLAQSVERANSTPVSRATSIDGDSEAEEDAREAAKAASSGGAGSGLYRRRRGPQRGDESPHLDLPHATALHLVRSHTIGRMPKPGLFADAAAGGRDSSFHYDAALTTPGDSRSGVSTPTMYRHEGQDYVPPPSKYHGGILSSLLRLYNTEQAGRSGGTSLVSSEQSTPAGTPLSSRPPSPSPVDGSSSGGGGGGGGGGGRETPKRLSGLFNLRHGKQSQLSLDTGAGQPPKATDQKPWNSWHPHHRFTSSTTSLSAGLLGTSSILATTGSADIGSAVTERVKRERPPLKRNRHSGNLFGAASPKARGGDGGGGNGRRRRREEEQLRITVHIAHVLSRHRYLTKLCRALMMYGAPTHRLEDYLKMSARILEIEAQFLYIPGCMLVSFDDSSTHTAEVKLVRAPQGVDLGKLRDVHTVYKEVVHDLIGVDEAAARLDEVMKRKLKFKRWLRVPVYGLASVCVAPFAFQGRFIDLPVAFVLGCIVGALALWAAPSSAMYSNVFEISAAVITSFLARAAGSLRGGNLFCFSALAQSSIALILPGYMVLCASLELQSQNIVAGSVRMVYAMIYTLFLGYGITIGTAVYGAIDSGATSATACRDPLTRPWYFLFVPLFTICLCIINQAKWKQIPIMVFISVAGFAVNTYASSYFNNNAQIPNTLGALCVGVVANLYARLSRYFERYFLLAWSRYGEPQLQRFRRRRERHRWRGLSSRPTSRPGSRASKENPDGYFDMAPYPADDPARAEEGQGGVGGGGGGGGGSSGTTLGGDGNNNNNNTNHTESGQPGHAGGPGGIGMHASSEATAAAVAAEQAAAVVAERKAPGSAEVMGYGLAAAAMLPAIFVQVPSGLAVNGSLLSGISAANQLTHNSTTSSSTSGSDGVNSVAFSVLFSVVQVAIGITVGLFLSALIVYPLGKRRSALFSF